MDGRDRLPVEEIAPLTVLAAELDVPLVTMRRWADRDRANNFPRPVETVGRVKFYERAEVERWVRLWRMTDKSNNFKEARDG